MSAIVFLLQSPRDGKSSGQGGGGANTEQTGPIVCSASQPDLRIPKHPRSALECEGIRSLSSCREKKQVELGEESIRVDRAQVCTRGRSRSRFGPLRWPCVGARADQIPRLSDPPIAQSRRFALITGADQTRPRVFSGFLAAHCTIPAAPAVLTSVPLSHSTLLWP